MMADNAKLKSLLLQAKDNVFAVLDGAQFTDLPMALFDGGFRHRSLYLDVGIASADQVKTSPQLVCLSQQNEDATKDSTEIDPTLVDRLLNLIGERPAVVFWQCDAGADVLYRHLRGINQVLYPKAAYLERDGSIPDSGFEMVTLRHADANVMAQVSSAFDWNGLSRLLGPAQSILIQPDADWSPRPMRLQRHDEMPRPYLGALKIGAREIRAMRELRFTWLKRRTILYLNDHAAVETSKLSEAQLDSNVTDWLKNAQTMRVTEEAAFRKWAYMQLIYDGRLERSDLYQDFKADHDNSISANDRVHLLMSLMIKRAEAA